MAETHHLHVALASRREVATPFGTAHCQCGERVFERLFKSQEFEDRLVDRRVEAYAALVRAYGIGMLYAVAHIVLHLAAVVDPRYAERVYAVGYAQAFDEVVTFKFGIFVVHIFN